MSLSSLLPPSGRQAPSAALSAKVLLKVGVWGTASLALGAAAAVYGRMESEQFTLRRHTLSLLPPGAESFRILHLSDIHMNGYDAKKGQWLKDLAAVKPHLVINTGDNLNHDCGLEPLLEALQPLLAFPGVFVPGSHDYYQSGFHNPLNYFRSPRKQTAERACLNTSALHEGFAERGWVNLANRSQSLILGGIRWDFSGVDDPHIDRDHFPGWPHGSATDAEAPHMRVALTHAPYQRVLDAYTNTGAQLIFAGHTHGGQICLPGYGALVSNCDLPTWRASGLSTWNYRGHESLLCVSAGIGTSRYTPWRTACPPEAVLLTLTGRT